MDQGNPRRKAQRIGSVESRYWRPRNRINVADPPFNNKKLRLAVAHAIDRKEILQAAYFGLASRRINSIPRATNGTSREFAPGL
jgi:ABC-type transport system substrate-binding protein